MIINNSITFLELIQTHRRGQLLHLADKQFEQLFEAISETGNDGELTLKLPFKLNKAGQIECTPKLNLKLPQHAIGTGFYFIDDESRLTRRDPNQMDIEDEIARRRQADD